MFEEEINMQKVGLNKVPKEEGRRLLEKGGCPADNTTCRHLINGKCSLKKPDLYYRFIRRDGYACSSYIYRRD